MLPGGTGSDCEISRGTGLLQYCGRRMQGTEKVRGSLCVLGKAFGVRKIGVVSFICYRIAFYAPPRKAPDPDYVPTPRGKLYDPYREQMKKWVLEARAMPSEEFTIKSFDGLTLYARYYEYAPGAPIELMHHGYRGNSESDLSGGVQRCFLLGQSAFIIDVRCGGKSEHERRVFWLHLTRDRRYHRYKKRRGGRNSRQKRPEVRVPERSQAEKRKNQCEDQQKSFHTLSF